MKTLYRRLLLPFVAAVMLMASAGTVHAASYITQTSAGLRSATITWTDPQELISSPVTISKFTVSWGDSYSNLTKSKTVPSTTFRTTIRSLRPYSQYYVRVSYTVTYKNTGNSYNNYYSGSFRTIPGKARNLQVNFGSSQTMLQMMWNAPSGTSSGATYQYSLRDYNNKILKHGRQMSRYLSWPSYTLRRAARFRLRAYTRIGGKTYYGEWLIKDIVPQPIINSDRKASYIASGKLRAAWSPVGGATGYDVYVSRSKDSGYKKMASLGPEARSVTLSSFNGSRYADNTDYYVKVVTKSPYGSSAKTYGLRLKRIVY